eukprot:CAMPEP_0179933718 /NCGR_PEP_ID=MMETSP0983-20121128/12028_1 /TAXON_ID=483367 /ORGANISM="non described non described, Strain CCMP 2436" /LENGTH=93 /DNA_ID=CAMNT_0021838563 /DNA_START=357 /DNA_END=639 /DNA_ORIENTATION=-
MTRSERRRASLEVELLLTTADFAVTTGGPAGASAAFFAAFAACLACSFNVSDSLVLSVELPEPAPPAKRACAFRRSVSRWFPRVIASLEPPRL